MNEDKYLKNTKKKLTIIFTSLVFIIAFSLEIVFFTLKYYRESSMESKRFEEMTSRLSGIKTIDNLVNVVKFWREIKPKKELRRWDFLSFIVIDNDKNIIIQDINEELEDDFSSFIFDHEIDERVNFVDWAYVKVVNFVEKNKNYKIIFFKNSRYSLEDLLEDIFWFLIITSLFSFIFYYIWLKFVDKTLKPIEDNLKSMKSFVNDAWHELKTPISIIHGNLQIIKETKVFDIDAINESIEEINRLDKLIESLVNLSTINSLKKTIHLKIKDEIQYIIEKYEYLAKENNITVSLKSKWDIKLNANKEYFYIVFSNIISNAIKYSKKWWKVDIKIEKNKIIVEDNWKWIKDEELPKIWNKFFRWWDFRNTSWFWIWLSLVKKICDLYNWEIKVESTEWKGTKFEIIF